MSWLKEIIEEAIHDVEGWPDWMKRGTGVYGMEQKVSPEEYHQRIKHGTLPRYDKAGNEIRETIEYPPNMTEMQGDQPVRRVPRFPEASTSAMEKRHEDPVDTLLNERHETHGSFADNAWYGQRLRELWHNSPGYASADDRTREVMEYELGKFSRIFSGNPNERQHWEDIAGYATLQFHPDKQRYPLKRQPGENPSF